MDKMKYKSSRYQQVAVALAKQIVDGKYSIGEKIKARSTVASNFNVSPETARKAINLLVDLEIVEVKHGSGVTVLSRENAQTFLNKFESTNSLQELKNGLKEQILKQKEELDKMEQLVENIVAHTRDINNTYPFEPFQLLLENDSPLFGQQLKELNLWQTTGATLIAIERKGEIMLSPGPYALLERGDKIYFVGNEQTYSRVKNLFL
ncbi:TrkA C-terminal domain-containing protein [Streptococcus ovis]|uniref:TrkA C-terminal domain-containing protein n=1 Tax=Streptococcus ovis TaxID=82806 RepID=UPI000477D26F